MNALAWPAMGVHGLYVWGSVGAVALFIAVEVVGLWVRHRRALTAASRTAPCGPAADRPVAQGPA